MGKKKDKAKREAEAGGASSEMRFELPPQVAGLAAMMAKQAMTPAARQMIAGALHAAADAVARGAPTGARPPAPVPSVDPAAPEAPASSDPAYQPAFTVPPVNLPPEAARVVEAAASMLQGWAQTLGKPKGPGV